MKIAFRRRLLAIGQALFLFAVGATALNVMVFPYARAHIGYGAALQWAAFAAAMALFLLAGRGLRRADESELRRVERVVVPALIAGLFAVQLALGYAMEYTPAGDNYLIYQGAQFLAEDGNFEKNPAFALYFSRFSNQWGFLLLLSGFFRLLGLIGVESLFFPCVLVQAALYSGAVVCLLRMAGRFGGVRARLMAALMLAMCLPVYLAAGVLYTDTFSLPFVVFALAAALEVPRQKSLLRALLWALACGGIVLIGGQIKMTVAIVLIAAAIVWLLTMKPLRAIACCALSVLLMLGGMQAVRSRMTDGILDPAQVAQHNTPTIHWIMMSIPTGDNPYGGMSGDYAVTWGMMEAGASREAVMDSIYARMKDRIYTLRYPNRLIAAVMRKNAAAFGDGTFGMTEMLDDGPVRENGISQIVLEGRPLYRMYAALCSGVWAANMALAALSCLRDLKRGDSRAALLQIAMLGMMLFLLLWEARGRYAFGFMPVMLLLAMRGGLDGE